MTSPAEHQSKGLYEKAVKSPCADQFAASLKCLDDNNYEKDACQTFFDQYKDCKKLEVAQRVERRRQAASIVGPAMQQARHMGRYARRPAQEQRERDRLQQLNAVDNIPCNEDIQARDVRLIRDNNQHVVMELFDAIREAREQGLDLVQVGGDENYPACRIVSYKDYVTSKRSRAKELRRKMLQQRRVQEVKEVRVSPVIAEHDLAMKLGAVERFLAKGHKVKLVVHAKGWKQRQHAAETLKMLQGRVEGKAEICPTVKTEKALQEESEEEEAPKHGVQQLALMLQPRG